MTKDSLKCLDIDDGGVRRHMEIIHADLIAVAKNYGFIVDVAMSDVVMYLENEQGESLCIG